jgi:hypothetical protein
MVQERMAMKAIEASEVRVKLLAAKKFESDLLISNGLARQRREKEQIRLQLAIKEKNLELIEAKAIAAKEQVMIMIMYSIKTFMTLSI